MSVTKYVSPYAFLILCFLSTAAVVAARSEFEADGWDEIPEEEFSADKPRIDPDAHVECMYRSLDVDDDWSDCNFAHHYRLKVYTEAGVEELDKIDIEYTTGWRIYSLKARIIFPDRRLVRLEKDDFYKREIFEDGRFKGYAMSFSFPRLEPGCIIEYRYRAKRSYPEFGLMMELRSKWPTWQFDMVVDPYQALASRIAVYNSSTKLDKKRGDYVFSLQNQPALVEGDYLPPRLDFEPWVYMGYATELEQLKIEKYWGYRGGMIEEVNDDYTRPKQRSVKKLAAELFEGAQDDEEKLRRAYDYCADTIINLSYPTDAYTEQEMEDLKENRSPSDVIKHGYGRRMEINGLFASLATQAGFQAYLAQVENKSEHTFRYNQVGSFCLSDWIVGVRRSKNDTNYRFFDPGSAFLPFEELNPENVNARVIFSDEKYYYWRSTADVKPETNVARRIAKLTLNAYGDIEGTVKLIYTGAEALWRRRMFAVMMTSEIEEYLFDNEWKVRCPGAEVSDVKIENLNDRYANLVVEHSLKVPAFADLAGDRLILNPGVFEKGASPVLEEPQRQIGVFFQYSKRELDGVTIQLPEGFALETTQFDMPGFAGKILNRNSKLVYDEEDNAIKFMRLLQLDKSPMDTRVEAGGQIIVLPGPDYALVKAEFDAAHRLDAQELSLAAKPL